MHKKSNLADIIRFNQLKNHMKSKIVMVKVIRCTFFSSVHGMFYRVDYMLSKERWKMYKNMKLIIFHMRFKSKVL